MTTDPMPAEPEDLVFCDKHSTPHPRTDECVNSWPVKSARREAPTGERQPKTGGTE